MSGNGHHLGFTFFIGRMTEVLVPDIQGVSKKKQQKKNAMEIQQAVAFIINVAKQFNFYIGRKNRRKPKLKLIFESTE